MSLSARDLIPILMIAASIWAVFGYVRPQYATIEAERAQKQEYENSLEKANEARIRRESLLAEYNSVKPEEWKRLGKMLPSEPGGIQLVRDISGLAAVFGLTLGGFSFSEAASPRAVQAQTAPPPPQAGGQSGAGTSGPSVQIQIPTAPVLEKKILQLSFGVEASYADFLRFLRELEKSLELSDVRSLSVSRTGGGKGSSDNQYTFKVSVDTYWIQ